MLLVDEYIKDELPVVEGSKLVEGGTLHRHSLKPTY